MYGIIMSLAILIALPAFFIATLWKAAFKSRLEWLLDALTSIIFLIWLFQSGHWNLIGYFFRYVWIGLLIIALVISWRKTRALPFRITYTEKQKMTMGVHVVLLLVFGAYNAFVFTSYSVKEESIELAFPLKQGTYYVGHGGNNVLMNYHNKYEDQKYSLDILKLTKLGTRANGLYPKDLPKYAIYGDELYSPCNGKVVETRNHLPDLAPPESDSEHPEGNFVALVCEQHEATLFLAHMQEGSVVVAEGDEVKTGQLLGKVGNSGNTTEPHLHIHAELDGVGVPLTFKDRFLVRNSIIKSGK
ncbi:M23 family metallopeptidase [Sporosarcina sp. Marseille-Q4943]|uniref:M23 family metallopeptidase n=1 Tax=Sporosarcina sp. Marseille-Q4943 TaxID=2942204 RepID=UPI00208DC89A|nr:peptidoglycan DD-metalloendopeptidase family protein [Sporosarcina sp. Marseille-Q4943]